MTIHSPPEPRPYKLRKTKKRICVADYETDPFQEGREVRAFSCGFYDGAVYVDFWGDDCIEQFFRYLRENYLDNTLLIYMHNGGKFDAYLQYDYLDADQEPLWLGGRIVSAKYQKQEFRDSLAIMPSPLKKFHTKSGAKHEIDYAKMERPVRENHKREILKYQRQDCLVLYDAVIAFHDMFGDRMTMAGAALAKLRHYHGFETLTERQDVFFRDAYFGGRVECFESGVITDGPFYVYDVNSMYPSVMRNFVHPVSQRYKERRGSQEGYHFARIVARSQGALPIRADDGGTSFPYSSKPRAFFATRHEIEAGIETGRLEVLDFKSCFTFEHETKFDAFVDTHYTLRMKAAADKDEMLKEFFKYILNGSYGKFALNVKRFKTWAVTEGEIPDDKYSWTLECEMPNGHFLWVRPSPGNRHQLKNVATAASITGAARAQLLRGIATCERPLYCDTDSLICTGPGLLDLDGSRLGAWKKEADADKVAIAGKKLYALWLAGATVKAASKGNRLSFDPDEELALKQRAKYIERIANGEVLKFENQVPYFKRDGSQRFVSRTMRNTAKVATLDAT